MDQKTWLWRKRSSEKTIVANGEEVQQSVPLKKEVDLENNLKTLSEKLASVVDECSAKDKLVRRFQQTADDAIADKNRAEEEACRLREELDKALQQRATANERLSHLNVALKDCMDQLNNLRDDQEQRVHAAVMKTSNELEKVHKKLEERLSEMSKRLASATAESSHLSKALIVKEKLIDDLNRIKSQAEAEFEALMSRLDSSEKENAFLRYEFATLEKELDLRNEELEYCRRSTEASNKQQLENVKKIKRLEADCQRLRSLTRKRMPSPGIMASIRSDIQVQGINRFDDQSKALVGGSFYSPESSSKKKIGLLMNQVQELEMENEILKEFLAKKEEEILHHQKVKNPDEKQDEFRDQQPEHEHECRMIGASEMSLMDDFVEMEKLAIVEVDVPPLETYFSASNVSCSQSGLLKEIGDNHATSMTKELVPMENESSPRKPSDWLQNVAEVILEQHRISKRSVEELVGDVKIALNCTDRPEPSKTPPISGYITWKSPSSTPRSSSIQGSSNEFLQPDLNASLSKIIELVCKFDLPCSDECSVGDQNESKTLLSKATESRIHVFRWKSRDLATVIKEFLQGCNDLLDGKITYEKFIGDSASTLGWITSSCVSYEDHSTVRDEFRKHLGGDGPGTAMELEYVQNLMLEMEKMHSVLQVEIKGLENELHWIRSSDNDPDLAHKLHLSKEIITNLQSELECMKESRRLTEDQVENLKLINDDLDAQLAVTKTQLSEALQKLSCIEVELESKCHCCDELESTCLELQLQLESMTKSQHSEENGKQEELLQTGTEISKASAKLAECEETILKLGKQLKALGSAKELSVVDKVLSITGATSKKFKQQRSSLRDQMLTEDNAEHLKFSREIVSITDVNGSSAISRTSSRNFSFPDGQVSAADKYLRMKKDSRTAKPGVLVVVPKKKRGGGFGLLSKLLLRRKKSSSRNNNSRW